MRKRFALLSKRYINHYIILGLDVLVGFISSLALLVGFLIIFETPRDALFSGIVYCTVAIAVTFLGVILWRTYRSSIRFMQLKNLWRIVGCSFVKTFFLLLLILSFNLFSGWSFERQLVLVLFDGVVTMVALTLYRTVMISVYDLLFSAIGEERMPILIYGCYDKSVALGMRLKNSSRYKVVGFCVYYAGKTPNEIAGTPVFTFKKEEDIKELVRKCGIKGILFANHQDTQEEKARLLQYCKRFLLRTLIAPAISESAPDGEFQQWVRPINIEDLLGRPEINLNMTSVVAEFCDKVILVTGAAGSIGGELCRQLAQMGVKQLIMFDSAESPLHEIRLEIEKKYPNQSFVPVIGDVRVKERLRLVFDKYHPQIVFHAAAYKHVPLMEENPCEAVLVNVVGTRYLADIAVEYGVEKVVMVSTDKAVNPTNIMGASKRLAEIYVQSLGGAIQQGEVSGKTKFITTRFGNVLGSNGSVIPHFKKQIENGGPVTVTHPDITRFFMTIPEACRLVMEAATIGEGNDIFVFEMGDAVRIVDLATKMIELAGYKPHEEIQIEFTGLRPGEKLYEEVLSNEENTIPTHHRKIKIAKVREYNYADILDTYTEFERLSRSIQVWETVRLMKKIVPEFKSKNSRFEELDKEREA